MSGRINQLRVLLANTQTVHQLYDQYHNTLLSMRCRRSTEFILLFLGCGPAQTTLVKKLDLFAIFSVLDHTPYHHILSDDEVYT